MQAARVFGTVFLAMTIVFGTVLAFIPLGDAAYDEDGVRTTDTFSMFGKTRETSPAGEAADGKGASSIGYTDAVLDGTGGIDYLRLMGPALAAGLLLLLAALLLTATPKTSASIAGGLVALPGAVLVLGAVTAAVLGSYMHSYSELGAGSQVDWRLSAAAMTFLALALAPIAAGMGLVSARKRTTPVNALAFGEAQQGDAGWVAGRNLRCPDCSTVVTAGYGVVPICPNCNFAADYDGPAAPPVPARAVAN